MWGVEESLHLERVNTYRCNIYRGWTVSHMSWEIHWHSSAFTCFIKAPDSFEQIHKLKIANNHATMNKEFKWFTLIIIVVITASLSFQSAALSKASSLKIRRQKPSRSLRFKVVPAIEKLQTDSFFPVSSQEIIILQALIGFLNFLRLKTR